MDPKFSIKLIEWYKDHAREMPWRGPVSAYAIWVSEIMLQQTRVETVIPYYQRWMERFPALADLAQASEQEVLRYWEGLGYYSRARNLHRAARIVVQEHDGEIPQDAAGLRSLPGIGRYTSGAIASLAFGQDEPILDGNVRRVLSRVFNVRHPHRSGAAESMLWSLAEKHLPPGQAPDYNQGLIELGALICTPRSPDCEHCPVAADCQAYALDMQEDLPVRKAKAATPHYTVTAAVIEDNDRYLIAQRPSTGLLGSLWEFPGGKLEPGESLMDCLQREICEELDMPVQVGEPAGVYNHAYSHFSVTLHAFHCTSANGSPTLIEHQDLHWVTVPEMSQYPMGKIDRQIANYLTTTETEAHNDTD